MALQDIGLIWVRPGLAPETSYKPRSVFGDDIRAAIITARGSPPDPHQSDREPWLRVGTGIGAAIVNRQGIEMLRLVYNEGCNGTFIP